MKFFPAFFKQILPSDNITQQLFIVNWCRMKPFMALSSCCSHVLLHMMEPFIRRVGRYQRDNQNPYIQEQTTQWPKEKVQKDKQ